MTNEEILDRIEKAITENLYSQIWDQNLNEEIEMIRAEIKKEDDHHKGEWEMEHDDRHFSEQS